MSFEIRAAVRPSSAPFLFTKRVFGLENVRHEDHQRRGNADFCIVVADETSGNGTHRLGFDPPLERQSVGEVASVGGVGNGFNNEARGNVEALSVNACVPCASTKSLGEWAAMNPKGV